MTTLNQPKNVVKTDDDQVETKKNEKTEGVTLELTPAVANDKNKKPFEPTTRTENTGTVPAAVQEIVNKDEIKNVVTNDTSSSGVQNQDSANSATDSPKETIVKSTIEEIIQSFTSLDFMALGARQIEPISESELIELLSSKDEFVFGEVDKVEQFYDVWFDAPNRTYYVIRDSKHFIKWSKLSEYFASRLKMFEIRYAKALNVLREPQRVYIDEVRVCDPEALGYPSSKLLDGRASDQVYRNTLRIACRSISTGDSVVRVRCLGDTAVHVANANLIAYSRSGMYPERMRRSEFLAQVAVLERRTKVTLRELSAFDFYYPSFTPFVHQGVFDGFRKEATLRIHFSQPIVMPHVRYTPMTSSILIKNATVSITRASSINDIINRNWKPIYAQQFWAYILSFTMPGEIFIHCVFPDSSVDVAVKGFAALLMRLMLMYDERSILSNSTRETQESIDRAIIAWGVHADILEIIPEPVEGVFPLNNYRLRRGTPRDQRAFDFLKVRSGVAGTCAGDCAYPKPQDILRSFYPNICVRRNYAVDADDYQDIRESSLMMSRWRVYLAANAFLSSSASLAQYRTLFSSYAKHILEFFIRMNEFLKVSWYNIFRMTYSRSNTFVGACAQGRSPCIEINDIDFFLVAGKGLDINQFVPERTALMRLRFQSSFVKESFRVHLRLRHINDLWEGVGRLRSFPTRRRIQIACEDSKIFSWVRSELFASDEDRRIERVFTCFNFQNNSLACSFNPLLESGPELERMYGILSGISVHARLNFISRNTIMRAIDDRTPLRNVAVIQANLNTYSYRDVESFVRLRRFNSMFYASTATPFRLDVKFPYVFCFALAESENSVSLFCAKNIASDVSYEHHVENSAIKLLLLSVDRRDYQYEDDFAVSTHRVDEVFPEPRDFDNIVVAAVDFFMTLNLRTTDVVALTKKDFKFISLYS